MQLENFSGKTSLAIKQEYWATLTVANISAQKVMCYVVPRVFFVENI